MVCVRAVLSKSLPKSQSVAVTASSVKAGALKLLKIPPKFEYTGAITAASYYYGMVVLQ